MRAFLALLLGVLVGAAAVWFYQHQRSGRSPARSTTTRLEQAAQEARDNIQQKLESLNLGPQQIKDELARTGQIVRKKGQEAGKALADATADARTTASIKGKLLAESHLSSLNISVNTTDGIVTLSGSVSAPEDIGKAVMLAMETDGVREVISTLQVRARPNSK
jgi:osmotically-inducible protein OsmY